MNLDNIVLRYSPLTNRIFIARVGKGNNIALDKRDAMSEFWQTLVAYSFDGKMPEKGDGKTIQFGGGDEQFTLVITRNKDNDDA